jgi:hypothetical protein
MNSMLRKKIKILLSYPDTWLELYYLVFLNIFAILYYTDNN